MSLTARKKSDPCAANTRLRAVHAVAAAAALGGRDGPQQRPKRRGDRDVRAQAIRQIICRHAGSISVGLELTLPSPVGRGGHRCGEGARQLARDLRPTPGAEAGGVGGAGAGAARVHVTAASAASARRAGGGGCCCGSWATRCCPKRECGRKARVAAHDIQHDHRVLHVDGHESVRPPRLHQLQLARQRGRKRRQQPRGAQRAAGARRLLHIGRGAAAAVRATRRQRRAAAGAANQREADVLVVDQAVHHDD